eukprot:COSAG01_NODE_62680_length_283_cov_1.119565_1_plen_43_part_01
MRVRTAGKNESELYLSPSAADSLLKVPSQRTTVILVDPAACSR